MLGMIETVKSGVNNPFPEEFFTVGNQVMGDSAVYYKTVGERRVATLSAYGAPPKIGSSSGVTATPVKLMHSYEELPLNVTMFQNLMNYSDFGLQRMGALEVERVVRNFKQKYVNLRIAAMASTLFGGGINFDAAGNLLNPTASPVPNGTYISMQLPTNNGTAAAGVPSNSGTSIDPLGTGTAIAGLAAGDWNNSSTSIAQQVTNIRQAAAQLTNTGLMYAFYGRNVPKYITQNTTIQPYLSRSNVIVVNGQLPANQEYIQTGEIPSPTLDLIWRPAYSSFFADQFGAVQQLVGPNEVLFTPAYSPDWLDVVEGSYPVPAYDWSKAYVGETTNPTSATSIMNPFETKYGLFAYTVPSMKPPTASILVGDTFLVLLKNPLVCFRLTVSNAA
jgi:hypothetical protein